MFFKRKKIKSPEVSRSTEIEDVVEVIQLESPAERRERIAQELCADQEFAVRFDQAVKIIQGDRVMFMQFGAIPPERQKDCTYADSRQALLAMAKTEIGGEAGDYRMAIPYAVQRVLHEGRRFKTKEDVEKAFEAYKTARA